MTYRLDPKRSNYWMKSRSVASVQLDLSSEHEDTWSVGQTLYNAMSGDTYVITEMDYPNGVAARVDAYGWLGRRPA